jgi:D-glycero-alpha-D-manno-heptose 1-phosphate guanylyltransferase
MPRADLAAIVLAGGLGTRIRQLHPDVPKPLIPVAGRPFLDWILRYWRTQGIGRFIVSAGYRAEQIERHLAKDATLDAVCVAEDRPLGTGGAIRLAASRPECSDPFVVLNGDSLVLGALAPALAALRENDAALLGVEVEDTSRYGRLEISGDHRLVAFREKQPGRGLINAGVYVLPKSAVALFGEATPLSMEADMFPVLLRTGMRIAVIPSRAAFLDIGTPESLAEAADFIRQHFARE